MYFLASILITGLMMGMPLAFGMAISKPPEGAIEWLVFFISLCGAIGMMNAFFVRFILRPAIQIELKSLPTKIEFQAHEKKDSDFQERIDRHIANGLSLKERY